MARLLTALALLLAFTVTLESFAYTDAARSVRLPGNGASGAVDTAGGVITAKSAPSFAEPSAGDEQGRRELQTTQSDCADAITRNCDEFILQEMGLLIHQLIIRKSSASQTPGGSAVKTGSV
ncbi:unnamed protein product [Closterium sp. NIES-54]